MYLYTSYWDFLKCKQYINDNIMHDYNRQHPLYNESVIAYHLKPSIFFFP
jgi:hypothetical protein